MASSFRLGQRKGKLSSFAFPFALRPDPAAVVFNNALTQRKSDTRSGDVAPMKALKSTEDDVPLLGVKAFAVILNRNTPEPVLLL
jgi:hypothetical protein